MRVQNITELTSEETRGHLHNSMFYLPLIFGDLKYEGLTMMTSLIKLQVPNIF